MSPEQALLFAILSLAAAMGFLRLVGKELARAERLTLLRHLRDKQRREADAKRRAQQA